MVMFILYYLYSNISKSQAGDPESVTDHYGAEDFVIYSYILGIPFAGISWIFHYNPYDFAVCHICLC